MPTPPMTMRRRKRSKWSARVGGGASIYSPPYF
jgi:hypothetical protein